MESISNIKLKEFDLMQEIDYNKSIIEKITKDQIKPLTDGINSNRMKLQSLMLFKRDIDKYVKIHGIEPTHVFEDIEEYYGYKKSHDFCEKESDVMNSNGRIYIAIE